MPADVISPPNTEFVSVALFMRQREYTIGCFEPRLMCRSKLLLQKLAVGSFLYLCGLRLIQS